MTIRYSLSLRQVKDLLFERGIATSTAAIFFKQNRSRPRRMASACGRTSGLPGIS